MTDPMNLPVVWACPDCGSKEAECFGCGLRLGNLVPVADLTAAQERTRRIVEAGDALADAVAYWEGFPEADADVTNRLLRSLAAYREAVGGE